MMQPFPTQPPFSSFTVEDWVEQHKRFDPNFSIGMTDKQYGWYYHARGHNDKDVSGAPIIFLDAPVSSV